MIDHERTSLPVCPHCGHMLTTDDIHASGVDVWALAPAEGEDKLKCPACGQHYRVRGSYIPEYTTSRHDCDVCDFDEDCTCGDEQLPPGVEPSSEGFGKVDLVGVKRGRTRLAATSRGKPKCANCGQHRENHLPAGQCTSPGGNGWWHPSGVLETRSTCTDCGAVEPQNHQPQCPKAEADHAFGVAGHQEGTS